MADHDDDIQKIFQAFQLELDEHNDRRERLIKSSRDITTASKRLIFTLHRFPHQDVWTLPTLREKDRSGAAKKLFAEAHSKQDEIVKMIIDVAKREGLDAEYRVKVAGVSNGEVEIGRSQRYERAIGSGLEEFIEAISFLHFLEHTNLITLSQIQAFFLEADGTIIFPIPAHRYLLGLSDFTGELMRFATNAVGSGQASDVVHVIMNLMRDLRNQLDAFVPHIRDMKKKQIVTNQSIRKIEDISYNIKVRSAEFGSNPAALQEMLRRSLVSNSNQGQTEMEEE